MTSTPSLKYYYHKTLFCFIHSVKKKNQNKKNPLFSIFKPYCSNTSVHGVFNSEVLRPYDALFVLNDLVAGSSLSLRITQELISECKGAPI